MGSLDTVKELPETEESFDDAYKRRLELGLLVLSKGDPKASLDPQAVSQAVVKALKEATEQKMVDAYKPKDHVERMLCLHMIRLEDTGTRCFEHANKVADADYGLRYMSMGVKCLRLYKEMVETLDKHRTGGKQVVRVERVNIAAGGQAIVGNVTAGGRGGGEGKMP